LGIFDRVIASDATRNLKGDWKAAALVAEFGERGFDYVGDSTADLPVWSASRRALVVGSPTLVDRVQRVASLEKVFENPSVRIKDWARALRVYQWVKNVLVFIPLFAAHRGGDVQLVSQAFIAFLAFSLCASSVYIINDLLDLETDRTHSRKSSRPFASGRLSIRSGVAVAPILLAMAFLLSAALPPAFLAVLSLYFVVTLAYSMRLKRTTVLDVLLLAGLYTLRLLAGAAAVSVQASFWLLAFSMFLFLSLALVKRVSELHGMPADTTDRPSGRKYRREDLPVLMSMGTAAGYTAVMVLALYINSSASEVLYRRPEALWLLCPLLLFWISRVWLVTYRGQMHDDPIVFAFRDSISRWLVVPAAAIVWFAT
jgi:4-hydroxybenzoate polyprenyltransferase